MINVAVCAGQQKTYNYIIGYMGVRRWKRDGQQHYVLRSPDRGIRKKKIQGDRKEMNKQEAKAKCVSGWNIRCNVCGSYGAEWVQGERPSWGSLALCPKHKAELIAEQDRHAKEMKRLRTINFEQEVE